MTQLELLSILIFIFYFITYITFLITDSLVIGILSMIFGASLVILTILRIWRKIMTDNQKEYRKIYNALENIMIAFSRLKEPKRIPRNLIEKACKILSKIIDEG